MAVDKEFLERLRRAVEAADLTHDEIAADCGVVRPTVTHWLSGRNEPPRDAIERIARRCNDRAGWLSHGEEPMRDDAGDSAAVPLAVDERPSLTGTDG